MTQFQAARRGGTSLRAWRAIELGHRLPGNQLLEGIVKALQLTDTEVAYLRRLIRTATDRRPTPAATPQIACAAASTVNSHTGPGYAIDRKWQIIAANGTLQRAAPGICVGRNLLNWFFTDPHAQQLLPDWEHLAADVVGAVRSIQAHHPHDTWYETTMTQLSATSPTAHRLWKQHLHIAPPAPITRIRLRCCPKKTTDLTATHLHPAGSKHHLQIVLLV